MAKRLNIAMELMELGFELKRQKLTRENPDLKPEEITRMLQEWINSSNEAAYSSPSE